jgi:hypothetical protein
MNIASTLLCVGHTFFGREESWRFHSFVSSIVVRRSRPKCHPVTILPRKSSPSLWYRSNKSCAIAHRVQQVLCNCTPFPLLHHGQCMGYPMCCNFAVAKNSLQNVEHSFVAYAYLSSSSSSSPSTLDIQYRCLELSCVVVNVGSSWTMAVLNGIPPFTEQFHPSCHCAMWQSITCFSQYLKTILCTTTSCNLFLSRSDGLVS